MRPPSSPSSSDLFLKYLLDGNKADASGFIHKLTSESIPIQSIYENIMKPALYKVGELWAVNKITVAEEHTATAITEGIMNELYPFIANSNTGICGKVVVGCVEGEFHQVGARMVADMFEIKGWDTWFPGSNVPTAELIRYINKVNPDLVAISASIYFHLPMLAKMMDEIMSAFQGLDILVGGQAFRHGGISLLSAYPTASFIKDLQELEIFIDNYANEDA